MNGGTILRKVFKTVVVVVVVVVLVKLYGQHKGIDGIDIWTTIEQGQALVIEYPWILQK